MKRKKRERNSSSESQLIHQFTVVDYLLTGSTFPLSLPKQCCKRRNPINWALSFLCPGVPLSSQGPRWTVNSTICFTTYNQSFTETYKYTFPPLVCHHNELHWSLSVLLHTVTSAKPIALCTITQGSKTNDPTAIHDRSFQVIRLRTINCPTQRGQGSDSSPSKVFHHFALTCHTQAVNFLNLGNARSCLICVTPAFLLYHSHAPPRKYQLVALKSSGGLPSPRAGVQVMVYPSVP